MTGEAFTTRTFMRITKIKSLWSKKSRDKTKYNIERLTT